MKNVSLDQFTEEQLQPFRDRLRANTKKDLSSTVTNIMALAKKAVLKNEELTDQERILHETAMFYCPQRDAPDIPKVKSFNEWNSEQHRTL